MLATAQLTPAAEAGPHCRTLSRAEYKADEAPPPAAEAGLHCGADTGWEPRAVYELTPAAEAGLHCGVAPTSGKVIVHS